MLDQLQRKLVNVFIFLDLAKMEKKVPYDQKKVVPLQNKRVRRLVKKAYKIPFYKERFDKAGVKPEDIRTGDDLAKLHLLTKKRTNQNTATGSRILPAVLPESH